MELLDYLRWRNDVNLSTSPFNEIDNVLLACLSYMDFGELHCRGESFRSLEEVFELFCKTHSLEEIERNGRFTERVPLLLKEMIEGDRFKATQIGYYLDDLDKDKIKQFAAVAFLLPDGTNYISFRGTDSTITGWKEDFLMSCTSETEGAKEAARYLNKIAGILKGNIILGGHSKGGNFATYAAAFCDNSIKNRIVSIYNNDGPGFRDEIINSSEYKQIVHRIHNIVPQTSIIGQLLSNYGEITVIKSNAIGILQHDAMTWEVTKNKFVYSELDEFSKFVKIALGNWLEKIDKETRESVVHTVFSMIEETGSETFKEFGSNLIGNSGTVFKGLVKLPKDKKKELVIALRALIHSGGKTAINQMIGNSSLK